MGTVGPVLWILSTLTLNHALELSSRVSNPAHNDRVCSTWGNFHYKTFDGDIYQFPGPCNYLFSSNCKNTFEDFNIQIRRSADSQKPVLSYVVIKIEGLVIEMKKGDIIVGGEQVSLPFSQFGVQIQQTSVYVKVSAKLGLTLFWNKEDSLMLELSSKYMNTTCGLCGNMNGLSQDEFQINNVLLSPVQFGNLQKFDGPTEHCEDVISSVQKNCSDLKDTCDSMLSSPAFDDCNIHLPKKSYIEACMSDLCSCQSSNDTSCFCNTLAEYSRQCAHAGGRPSNWRNNICAITCPMNLQYDECGSPCADTCSNFEQTQVCEEHCIDGCFCPPGTVFDDVHQKGCIPLSECSCTYNNTIYAPGESYSTNCRNCICQGGKWSCQDLPCPGYCSLEGGSHIYTYDGSHYNLHGQCDYIFTKDCVQNMFTVLVELTQCGVTKTESCLKSVTLSLEKGLTVVSVKSSGTVLLNGIYSSLPLFTDNLAVLQPSSFYLIIKSFIGIQIQIQLNPVMQISVSLDAEYKGDACGLCGDFNNIQTDDFRAGSGLVEGTASGFANTWKAQADCPNVKESYDNPCSLSVENERYAQYWCSQLSDSNGIFAPCHAAVHPEIYQKNCMYDSCNYENSENSVCAALSAYVRACAAEGVILTGWRGVVCDKYTKNCPKNSTYQYAISTCQKTCRSLSDPDPSCSFELPTVDGCACPNGTYLHDSGACVLDKQCPCYYKGSIMPPGEVVYDKGAMCTCQSGRLHCVGNTPSIAVCPDNMVYFDCANASNGGKGAECQKTCQTLDMECFSIQCAAGCVCPDGLVLSNNGSCILEEECPCVHNGEIHQSGETIQQDCNTCTCKDRKWQCTQNECHRTCVVYGEGHYVTFDGKRFDFSGDCEYTLTQDYCLSNTGNGTFRVITENIPCGTTGATCSKAIKVFLGNFELKLSEGSYEVLERDIGSEVPYQVRQMGIYLVIEATNGLILMWDKKTSILIKLSPEFKGRVCGLCGNYDGSVSNDFITRSQSVVVNIQEFGNSWKAAPTCPDALPLKDPCVTNPYRQTWSQKHCSFIMGSTFSKCHSKVDPTPYHDTCVQDTCACDSGGDCECYCTAVAAYAAACSQAGICVSWRTPEICPLFCDYYNPEGECEWHYKPCGAPCMKTCRNPSGHCMNTLPGLEGCYPKCPKERPFFDEDIMKCVAQANCGCYDDDGKRYSVGDMVPSYKNCESCICTKKGRRCQIDERACFCYYGNMKYNYGDVIYNTTDGIGGCITATCSFNGTIARNVYPCVPTTKAPTTTFHFDTTSKIPLNISTPEQMSSTSVSCLEEVCKWSPWYDVTYPKYGIKEGDFETFDNIRNNGYSVCKVPSQVECRAKRFPKISVTDLGQKIQCNTSVGLVCYNQDQFSQLCYNYEISILCCTFVPCGESSASPTPFVTSSPDTTLTTKSLKTTVTTSIPPTGTLNPISSEKTTPRTSTIKSVTETVKPSTTKPQATTLNTPCQKEMCTWTEWIDVHFPSIINSDGDFETIENIRAAGNNVCSKPEDIECRAEKFPEKSIEEVGQIVTCNVTHGLICNNKDQKNIFPLCFNYQIRIRCCSMEDCEASTTLAASTAKIHSTEHPTTPEFTRTTQQFTKTTVLPTTKIPLTVQQSTKYSTHITGLPTTSSKVNCVPVCEWSQWFDVSFPNSDTNGDFETYEDIRNSGFKVCQEPSNIQCRSTVNLDVPLEELQQNVQCNISNGLVCRNEEQTGPFPYCYNYEIRVYCCSGCASTEGIPTSTKHSLSTTYLTTTLKAATSVPQTTKNRVTLLPTSPYESTTDFGKLTTDEDIYINTPKKTQATLPFTEPVIKITEITTAVNTQRPISTTVEKVSTTSNKHDSIKTTKMSDSGEETSAYKTTPGKPITSETVHPKETTAFRKSTTKAEHEVETTSQKLVSMKTTKMSTDSGEVTSAFKTTPEKPITSETLSPKETTLYRKSTTGGEYEKSTSQKLVSMITTKMSTESGEVTSAFKTTSKITSAKANTDLHKSTTESSHEDMTSRKPVTTAKVSTESHEVTSAHKTTPEKPITSETMYPKETTASTTLAASTAKIHSTEHPTTPEFTRTTQQFTKTTVLPTTKIPLTVQQSTKYSTHITGLPTTSSKVNCVPVCEWSQWFDVSFPNSDTNGDFETYEDIRNSGFKVCQEPSNIQCRSTVNLDVPLEELQQNVQCNISNGLVCRNEEQTGPFPYCYNYEIRVYCCSGCASTEGIPTSTKHSLSTTYLTTTLKAATSVPQTTTPGKPITSETMYPKETTAYRRSTTVAEHEKTTSQKLFSVKTTQMSTESGELTSAFKTTGKITSSKANTDLHESTTESKHEDMTSRKPVTTAKVSTESHEVTSAYKTTPGIPMTSETLSPKETTEYMRSTTGGEHEETTSQKLVSMKTTKMSTESREVTSAFKTSGKMTSAKASTSFSKPTTESEHVTSGNPIQTTKVSTESHEVTSAYKTTPGKPITSETMYPKETTAYRRSTTVAEHAETTSQKLFSVKTTQMSTESGELTSAFKTTGKITSSKANTDLHKSTTESSHEDMTSRKPVTTAKVSTESYEVTSAYKTTPGKPMTSETLSPKETTVYMRSTTGGEHEEATSQKLASMKTTEMSTKSGEVTSAFKTTGKMTSAKASTSFSKPNTESEHVTSGKPIQSTKVSTESHEVTSAHKTTPGKPMTSETMYPKETTTYRSLTTEAEHEETTTESGEVTTGKITSAKASTSFSKPTTESEHVTSGKPIQTTKVSTESHEVTSAHKTTPGKPMTSETMYPKETTAYRRSTTVAEHEKTTSQKLFSVKTTQMSTESGELTSAFKTTGKITSSKANTDLHKSTTESKHEDMTSRKPVTTEKVSTESHEVTSAYKTTPGKPMTSETLSPKETTVYMRSTTGGEHEEATSQKLASMKTTKMFTESREVTSAFKTSGKMTSAKASTSFSKPTTESEHVTSGKPIQSTKVSTESHEVTSAHKTTPGKPMTSETMYPKETTTYRRSTTEAEHEETTTESGEVTTGKITSAKASTSFSKPTTESEHVTSGKPIQTTKVSTESHEVTATSHSIFSTKSTPEGTFSTKFNSQQPSKSTHQSMYPTSGKVSTESPVTSTSRLSTATTESFSTVRCMCNINRVLVPPGQVIYNTTDNAGWCFYAKCNQNCEVERYSEQCYSSTVPTVTSSTKTANTVTASTGTMTTKKTESTTKKAETSTKTSQTSQTKTSTSSTSSTSTINPGCSALMPPRAVNESWMIDNCTQARCIGGNNIAINKKQCAPIKEVVCANRLQPQKTFDDSGCCYEPECECVCGGWGTSNYITFDGTYYSFNGQCTYVLVQQITPVFDHFRVYIDNFSCNPNDPNCVKTLRIMYKNDTIVLKSQSFIQRIFNQIYINEQRVYPAIYRNGILIKTSGIFVVVEIPELGAYLSFNALSFTVKLPISKFSGNTQGHCGKCSNNRIDDCILPNGQLAPSCTQMAGQWNTPSQDSTCSSIPTTTPTGIPSQSTLPFSSLPPTYFSTVMSSVPHIFSTRVPSTALSYLPSTSLTTKQVISSEEPCNAPEVCTLILSSVFEKCRGVVPPEPYYQACVTDGCTKSQDDILCSSLQSYARICGIQGVCLDWRNSTNGLCSMNCSSNLVYNPCGPAVERTCDSRYNDAFLNVGTKDFMEGCYCPENMTKYNAVSDKCVSTCGCTGPDGMPREPGDTWDSNCKTCRCDNISLSVQCVEKSCALPVSENCTKEGYMPVSVPDLSNPCCLVTECRCNVSLCSNTKKDCGPGYEAVLYMSPEECCPIYKCEPKDVCLHNGTEYQPGTPVLPSNPCEKCMCDENMNETTGIYHVSCTPVICDKKCAQGFKYTNVPGQCCGICEQTECIMDLPDNSTHLLKPGDTWSPPGDNCTEYECIRKKDNLLTVASKISCPRINLDECVPDTIQKDPSGCCLTCMIKEKKCQSVKTENIILQNGCKSIKPVTMSYCKGNCDSYSKYSVESQSMEQKCVCCQETATEKISIILTCPNGKNMKYSFINVKKCSCVDTTCKTEYKQNNEEDYSGDGNQSDSKEKEVDGKDKIAPVTKQGPTISNKPMKTTRQLQEKEDNDDINRENSKENESSEKNNKSDSKEKVDKEKVSPVTKKVPGLTNKPMKTTRQLQEKKDNDDINRENSKENESSK
ncbi:mucin-5AC-like [Bufo gargarizans]|uniref:mucin-5AC-like n=1 Tax=Bufo gargarizans TaxID=30331 RepID=UPI001CF2A3E7|nr:mucin-5AC-like [Bufo gargarizans]